jgi:hypothetical protein
MGSWLFYHHHINTGTEEDQQRRKVQFSWTSNGYLPVKPLKHCSIKPPRSFPKKPRLPAYLASHSYIARLFGVLKTPVSESLAIFALVVLVDLVVFDSASPAQSSVAIKDAANKIIGNFILASLPKKKDQIYYLSL